MLDSLKTTQITHTYIYRYKCILKNWLCNIKMCIMCALECKKKKFKVKYILKEYCL